ncbi:protein DOUBLE-STRAND BREAK FORMATION-like [Coffea arabica]|uniref:Protein DOUBLE-STRAND BREAK FORMATION-like n=1 Tax=Coffea arabica TaxID=13443 RepID=A0ABM4WW09_COFAR
MSNEVSRQISLFSTQMQNRIFGDGTIAILESLLASKDVKSSLEIRSALKEFMRHESLSIIREITEKSVENKLLIADFLIRAFVLIGDVESCLALRYEALLLRDEKASSDTRLEVSYHEWLTLAEQLFDNGFYSAATKTCERALLCIQMDNGICTEDDDCFNCEHAFENIKRLKDAAIILAASQTGTNRVQVQASEYMKKKINQQLKQQESICTETYSSGSTLFRNGIKRRNLRKLQEHQCL